MHAGLFNARVLDSHPITHHSSIPRIHGTGSLKGNGKGSNFLHAFPDRFGAGMTVVFAPEKAAEVGDQAHPLTQGWGRFRRRAAMGHDPGRRPFLGIEHHVTRQVRAVPAPGHQVQGAPGDGQVNHQGSFQPLQRLQLQRLDPAACFPNLEKNFDIPLRMPLYD